MQKHVKTYFDYFGYCKDEKILCEGCGRLACDIHHLTFRSHQGKDNIENLIALCRDCHNAAHSNPKFNNKLKEIHLKNC